MNRTHMSKEQWFLSTWMRIVLVVVLFAETMILSRSHFARLDLTDEKLYTLTASTDKVLASLNQKKDRLVIECYFTKDSSLPAVLRDERAKIVEFLDEYRLRSGGAVDLVYYAPEDDKSIEEKAERIGITRNSVQVVEEDSISAREVFQGLRLVFGGGKQKVLPIVQSALTLESELTPKIKELALDKKPKLGIYAHTGDENPMARQMRMQQSAPAGFEEVESLLKARFEVQKVDLADGKLVPEDIEALFVFLPKDLGDREKYALDQFLMRGKHMAVFMDVADYQADYTAMMMKTDIKLDTPDSKTRWLDQLAAYGAKVENRIALDGAMHQRLNDTLLLIAPNGRAVQSMLPFPYFVKANELDFARPELLAQVAGTDAAAAERLKKELGPGLDRNAEFFKGVRSVSLFWPCPVGLAEKLPDGVKGRVVMRTSPYGLTEEAPFSTNPKAGGNPRQAVMEFQHKIQSRVKGEARKQVPLAVLLEGTFTSFFKGKEIPQKKKPEAPPADSHNPMGGPGGLPPGFPNMPQLPQIPQVPPPESQPATVPGSQPGSGNGGSADPAKDEDGNALFAQDPAQDGAAQSQPASQPASQAASQPGSQPAAPGAAKPEEKKDQDPDPIFQSKAPSRLLVVGDATFLRDDALRQGLGNLIHPMLSQSQGTAFFENLAETFSLDADLVALRTRKTKDRRFDFGLGSLDETPDEQRTRINAQKTWIKAINIGLTPILLLGFGVLLLINRSAEKNKFLRAQNTK